MDTAVKSIGNVARCFPTPFLKPHLVHWPQSLLFVLRTALRQSLKGDSLVGGGERKEFRNEWHVSFTHARVHSFNSDDQDRHTESSFS